MVPDPTTTEREQGPAGVAAAGRQPRSPKQCDIYVIDTGRCAPVRLLVDEILLGCSDCRRKHNVYVLTPKQSGTVLRAEPQLHGQDPVVLVLDSDAFAERRPSGYGFHFILGSGADLPAVTKQLRDLVQVLRTSQRAGDVMTALRSQLVSEPGSRVFRLVSGS